MTDPLDTVILTLTAENSIVDTRNFKTLQKEMEEEIIEHNYRTYQHIAQRFCLKRLECILMLTFFVTFY